MLMNRKASSLAVFAMALACLHLAATGCLRMRRHNPVDPGSADELVRRLPTVRATPPPLLVDDCEDGDRWVSCSSTGRWRSEVPFFSGATVTPNDGTPESAWMLGTGPASPLALRAWGQLVCKYVPPPYFGYVLLIAEARVYSFGYTRLALQCKGSGDKPLSLTVTLRYADGDQFAATFALPGAWNAFDLPFTGFAPLMASVHPSPQEETELLQEVIFSVSAVGAKDEVVNYDIYLDDLWLE